MNIKTISAACLFAALNIGAISAHASTHRDIQKVVAHSTESSASCEAVNNNLTYLDSKGQTHSFDYLTLSDECNQGG